MFTRGRYPIKQVHASFIQGSAGVSSAIVLLKLWDNWEGHADFKAKLEQSPLAFIEHYHWGLASLIVGGPFFNGVGAVLAGSEFFGENPFGIGKSEGEVRGNLFLTFLLAGIFAVKKWGI